MLFTYVLTYFIVTLVCAIACFIILWQMSSDMGSEQEVRAFRSYIYGYIIFSLSNSVWVWINYGYLDIPGWPWSMANLIAICVSSYYWFKYVELRLNPAVVASPYFRVASLLPLAVAVLLVVTTPFTRLVFYYEGNEYLHGPLYPTMAVLATLYLIFASVHMLMKLSSVHAPSQRRQYYMLMLFLVFPVAAGVVDIMVPNLPVLELALLLGTILVYTSMQQSQIYSDVLTGLNNRRLADDYLLESIEGCSEENPVYFFIGDADQFKAINDVYGHAEGDRALRHIATGLKRATGRLSCHMARWGGDEFVVIIDGKHLSSPEELIDSINRALEDECATESLPYSLHLSFGYAKCTSPDTTPAVLLEQADELMYLQKGLRKAA